MSPTTIRSFQRAFGRVARSVCPERFREDFLQEMWLALVQAKPGQSRTFYIRHAKNRGQDFLRHELLEEARCPGKLTHGS